MTNRIAQVEQAAARHLFSKPIVTNVYRAVVAEAIIADCLGPEWEWCSGDYNAWDFKHADGTKLEVKQSAALQPWSLETRRVSKASFDIAERKGRYDKDDWVDRQCRWADIYVFAHHPHTHDDADQRDADQWDFYVVATDCLPRQDTIGLAPLKKIAVHCRADELRQVVNGLTHSLPGSPAGPATAP